MRRWICRAVSPNWRSFCSLVPVANAGSGMLQWATIGWPGKMGQDSLALSQTVIMMSKRVSLNSSHDLLRAAPVSIPYCSCNTRMARGLTFPAGWLPAL